MKKGFLLSLMGLFLVSHSFAEGTLSPEEQKMIRDLESELSPLKEQVYKTKAKVQDLKDAVLHGKIVGSKAFISFENQAEGFFVMTAAEFYLDDELLKKIVIAKNQKPISTTEILNGDILSGEHTLRARIVYRGSDRSLFKAFSYFKDHEFVTEANEKISVDYGKTTMVKLITLDKGYFKNKVDERLFLQVNISQDWGTETVQ